MTQDIEHMEISGIKRTVHVTDEWLAQIAGELEKPDKVVAYHALRGVLFALRDRIPVAEAMDLAAQFPALIRGFYFEGYKTTDKPKTYRSRDEFLQRVDNELKMIDNGDAEEATRAVFAVLSQRIDAHEAGTVRRMLPEGVRDLWPEEIVE